MLRHYYINAIRIFWRNKVSTLINILGLAIGISAAFIIYLIVQYDFSFDRFHIHEERIYHVVTNMVMGGRDFPNGGVEGPLPGMISREVPGLEETATFYMYGFNTVTIPATAGNRHPLKVKTRGRVIFADEHYFGLFSYKWLAGTPVHVLRVPGQVVLTDKQARRYFPELSWNQMVGRPLLYDDSVQVFVTGVVAAPEQPTDLNFSDFISYSTLTGTALKNAWANNWNSLTSAQQCFVRLAPASSPEGVARAIAAARHKYDPNASVSETKNLLQPLRDLHFNAPYSFSGTASKPALYGLMAASLFLLLLACINYINLSTAQASRRAKEIGIRKVMGGSRSHLFAQFLGETFCITLCAALLAAILTPFLVRAFQDYIPRGMTFNPLKQFHVVGVLFALTAGVAFLSGFYPALILSGLKPVLVLKNQVFNGGQGTRRAWFRRTLTVFQFIIAQIFVLATLLVAKQINYALHKDLGYRKDAIIFFSIYYQPHEHNRFTLLNEINALPGVERVSLGSEPPGSSGSSTMSMGIGDSLPPVSAAITLKSGDTNYIRVYDLKLLAGRNLEQSDATKEYIVNMTFARLLDPRHPQNAIGKQFAGLPIVGIVNDFNQGSLHKAIEPLAISSQSASEYTIHVALRRENTDGTAWKKTIAAIEAAYKKLYPGSAFNYQFYDESIAAFYKTEQNTASLLEWATGLAILISCLGLLGLVVFITKTRTKEIGVRKVLGASVLRIAVLLSADFMRLVLLAFVIATPVAWYAMNRWLDTFADRTAIAWWVFVLGGLVIAIAAVVTLSFQTIRAARANPVKSLRAE